MPAQLDRRAQYRTIARFKRRSWLDWLSRPDFARVQRQIVSIRSFSPNEDLRDAPDRTDRRADADADAA